MKELFGKTSTTSIIAVLLLISCMVIMSFMVATSKPHDATTRTQIVQGLFGLLMMMGGYYFGSSKQRTGVTQQADTITNSPAPTDLTAEEK